MNNGNSRRGNAGKGGNERRKSTPSKPMNKTRKPKPSAKPDAASPQEGGRKPYTAKPAFDKKPEPKKPAAAKANPDEMRLNRYISNSGMCSRRDADIYIQSGNVKVNGKVVTEMGYKVRVSDRVEFDGTVITPEKKEYL